MSTQLIGWGYEFKTSFSHLNEESQYRFYWLASSVGKLNPKFGQNGELGKLAELGTTAHSGDCHLVFFVCELVDWS